MCLWEEKKEKREGLSFLTTIKRGKEKKNVLTTRQLTLLLILTLTSCGKEIQE